MAGVSCGGCVEVGEEGKRGGHISEGERGRNESLLIGEWV